MKSNYMPGSLYVAVWGTCYLRWDRFDHDDPVCDIVYGTMAPLTTDWQWSVKELMRHDYSLFWRKRCDKHICADT